jgi:SNF2 family DNA or RNA helicase
MVKNILVLTPASLVSQWKEEMQSKFGVEFITTDDPDFMKAPEDFWKQRFIIASINTAKSSRNMQLVVNQFYDLVVVDEAHHLRNRSTLSWKLVNQIKKRFIFLLTATPVQNNLIELFNLITLLKPGQFKTEKEFKKEYLSKGSLKETADKEKMRGLLRDVMIRNTRSAIDLKLPKRFAVTMRISPTNTEKEIYTGINQYLMEHDVPKTSVNLLLREAGSSLFALKESLLRMKDREGLRDIINKILDIKDISKGDALIRILQKNPAEKKIVFTHFIKSMDYIGDLLSKEGIPYVIFKGTMPLKEKDAAIAGFKNDVPVLVSTESGGEGRNLQFCNTIINFDLPWNPMRIEQRIGRLHRIGQTRDVFIFNLSVRDTIEDYIIEILDSKINMFEMVIGEIEPILGHLGEDRDFEEIILDIWAESKDNNMLKQNFERLGNDMVKAKNDYLRSKSLDNAIFGEDYET